MTNTYDGTNPLFDLMGDQHTERDVSMINHSAFLRYEPLTHTPLPPGETVLVRVTGDIAHEQLIKNLAQINELRGFEVIGVASVVVDETGGEDDEPVKPTAVFILQNANRDEVLSNVENTGLYTARTQFAVGSRIHDVINLSASQPSTGYAGLAYTQELDAAAIQAGYIDVDLGDVRPDEIRALTLSATLKRGELVSEAVTSVTTIVPPAEEVPPPFTFLTGLTVEQVTPNTEDVYDDLLHPVLSAPLGSYIGHSFATGLTAGSELKIRLQDLLENYIAISTGSPVPTWSEATSSSIRLNQQSDAYNLIIDGAIFAVHPDSDGWLKINFSATNLLEFFDGISGELIASKQLASTLCYFSLFRFAQTAETLPIGFKLTQSNTTGAT